MTTISSAYLGGSVRAAAIVSPVAAILSYLSPNIVHTISKWNLLPLDPMVPLGCVTCYWRHLKLNLKWNSCGKFLLFKNLKCVSFILICVMFFVLCMHIYSLKWENFFASLILYLLFRIIRNRIIWETSRHTYYTVVHIHLRIQ